MARGSRDTRKVIARLEREGWVARTGKGDHLNFCKAGNPCLITIDAGKKELDKAIYGKVKRMAGWE